jgi:hypothetical protein
MNELMNAKINKDINLKTPSYCPPSLMSITGRFSIAARSING